MFITDLIPAHRLHSIQAAHDRAMAARLRSGGLIGITDGVYVALASEFTASAAASEVRAGQLRRLGAPDRHTRAIAQAQAAGITGLRDVWTAGA